MNRLILLAVTLYLPAAGESFGGSFDFFNSEEPLKMSLAFDVKKLLRTKSNPEYMEALISVHINENETIRQMIKVKARGERRREYCQFPPLMLKIKNQPEELSKVFSEGKIKLVTHCAQSAVFEDFLLKEYLAYKLYNLVTPFSFKTRLVDITYIDSENPDRTFTEKGFIIESVDQLAARNNALVIKNGEISQKHMDALEMTRMAVFSYMIGNTDWSVYKQHNVKVLSVPEKYASKGIPVAYDFDYSGFVNAHYATPTANIPINYVTDRYYMGTCDNSEMVNAVIQEFLNKQDAFMNAIDSCEYLPEAERKKAMAYIALFYKKNNTQVMLTRDFNRTCQR